MSMKMKFIYSLFTIFCILHFSGYSLLAASSSTTKGKLAETFIPIWKQEPGVTFFKNSIAISPDKAHVTYVIKENEDFIVCVDGKPQKKWKKVVAGTPIFSGEKNRVAYIAADDKKAYVVVDGKSGPAFDHIWDVSFSPDGKHFAYPAVIGTGNKKKVYFVINHRVIGKAVFGITQFKFSPDSRNLVYVALLEDGKWHTILNNKVLPGYDFIESITFSPNSKRLVYTAKEKDTKYIVLDGKKLKFSGVQIGMSTFSPDSSRFAYALFNKDIQCWEVVVDGKKIDAMKKPFGFKFSPDSKQFAFQGGESSQQLSMHINGVRSNVYSGCSDPFFSPDSKKVVYFAKEDEGWFMVVNGKKGRVYEEIFPPVFNEKFGHMAYRVKIDDNRMRVMSNEKAGDVFDSVGTPFFSKDGKKLAYVVTNNGKWFFMINGQKYGKEYEAIGTAKFSDDGEHFVYTALKPDGLWRLVIDGHETIASFNQAIPGAEIVFLKQNKISLLIVKIEGDITRMFRLEVAI